MEWREEVLLKFFNNYSKTKIEYVDFQVSKNINNKLETKLYKKQAIANAIYTQTPKTRDH